MGDEVMNEYHCPFGTVTQSIGKLILNCWAIGKYSISNSFRESITYSKKKTLHIRLISVTILESSGRGFKFQLLRANQYVEGELYDKK